MEREAVNWRVTDVAVHCHDDSEMTVPCSGRSDNHIKP